MLAGRFEQEGLNNLAWRERYEMLFNPHLLMLAVATVIVGWLMTYAGLQKSALELKRRRRVCPSCGRQIEARVCSSCS
jgi:hypothetical protein